MVFLMWCPSAATEALRARIEERKAERARIVAYNASCRKGAKTGTPGDASLLDDSQRASLASCLKHQAYQCPNGQFPTYHLANLSARIRNDEQRLVSIDRREARRREAEAAGGILVSINGDYAAVTFAEKPERETLAALRSAGFHWSAPSWHGRAAALEGELASLTGR